MIPILGGITLLGCQGIRPEKSANIIPLPMPMEDSTSTEIFDMLGVVKFISVQGQTGGSTANLKSFMDSLELLCNGNQSGTTFNSDQTGSIICMVMSVSANWEIPGTVVTYEIKLVQGVAS